MSLKNNSFEFSCLLRHARGRPKEGLNTKMIPRSFETAASFITRRLIQYHASLVRISTVLFTGHKTFNIWKSLLYDEWRCAAFVGIASFSFSSSSSSFSSSPWVDDRFALSCGWGHARIHVGIYECLLLFYVYSFGTVSTLPLLCFSISDGCAVIHYLP